jgi:hypothetical protein
MIWIGGLTVKSIKTFKEGDLDIKPGSLGACRKALEERQVIAKIEADLEALFVFGPGPCFIYREAMGQ